MSQLGRTRWAAFVVMLSAAPGCRSCKQSPAVDDAVPTGVHEAELEVAPGKPLAAPKWTPREMRGIGLPSGCKLEQSVLHAALPASAHFFAAQGVRDWLAVRTEAGERALIELAGQKTRDLPWEALESPPLIARGKQGWLAALVRSGEPARAFLWRENRPALEIARGDQLEIADLSCRAERCAVLTTLARTTAEPGATLAFGDPGRSDGWTALEIAPDPTKPWRPLAIVALGERAIDVALETGQSASVWRVEGERARKLGEVKTPFGIWDIVASPEPLVIAPGASLDGGCQIDSFPLELVPLAGKRQKLTLSVPPESVIARPLAKGALLAWVAPVSCHNRARTVVHALVANADGSAQSGPMAVADASGFSLATEGSRVSLWLRTPQGLTWIRARCGS